MKIYDGFAISSLQVHFPKIYLQKEIQNKLDIKSFFPKLEVVSSEKWFSANKLAKANNTQTQKQSRFFFI